jgi:dGTPase
VSPTEGLVIHNRLTHTLEVAQIARRIAEKLLHEQGAAFADTVGGVDPDVVEAAALAHDLGHPPFGHIAEQALCQLLDAQQGGLRDGFEGNAQSFRIVTKLAVRHQRSLGLNLSRATLNAILKYPRVRGTAGKWGVYDSEQDLLAWVRRADPADTYKSAEAEIMDWADDVAYSVHDVDDFFRAGIMPLDQLTRKESKERDRFLNYLADRRRDEGVMAGYPEERIGEVFADVVDRFPLIEPYRGIRHQRGALRSSTAKQIKRYVDAIQLVARQPAAGRRVVIDADLELEVAVLKELTRYYVVNTPSLATQQYGQQQVMRRLFEIYTEAAESDNLAMFPEDYREQLEEADEAADDNAHARTRVVIDLIASMTEQQALRMYQRFTGNSLGSVLDTMER